MEFFNKNDALYDRWNESLITYINETKKQIYKQVGFPHASKRDVHNFKKIRTKIHELGFNYSV